MDSTQWVACVDTVNKAVSRINGDVALARTSDSDPDDRIELVIGVSSSNFFSPVAESEESCARCVTLHVPGHAMQRVPFDTRGTRPAFILPAAPVYMLQRAVFELQAELVRND